MTDPRFTWTERGSVAFDIWVNGERVIATVGHDEGLRYERLDDPIIANNPQQREADERGLLEGREAAMAWTLQICEALNRATTEPEAEATDE